MLVRGVAAMWILGGGVLVAQSTGPLSQMSMPTVSRSTTVRAVIPAWVAMPPVARILASEGLDLQPLRNSAVTDENTRVGVLVGALTNAGRCARQVRAFLQYTDDRWRPVGTPIESEARVSDVGPGGILPYRFRLRRNDEFERPPSGYLLQVVEDGKPAAEPLHWKGIAERVDRTPCAPAAATVMATVTHSRATLRGYRVSGTVTVGHGGPIRRDGLAITALLRDRDGHVLDVLVGVPRLDAKLPEAGLTQGQSVPFALTSSLPLGKAVASTTLFTDILPDAIAASR